MSRQAVRNRWEISIPEFNPTALAHDVNLKRWEEDVDLIRKVYVHPSNRSTMKINAINALKARASDLSEYCRYHQIGIPLPLLLKLILI